MKRSDISELIAFARGFDDRIEDVTPPYRDEQGNLVEDARIAAWHMILGDLDPNVALQGIAELYREPQMMRLQPGHIFQAAKKVMRRNLDRADLTRLVPPREIAAAHDEDSRDHEWRKIAIQAIASGHSVDEAQDIADDRMGVTRREIGPASRRDVMRLIEGRTA